MMWTDHQIIAALNGASAVVERLVWLLKNTSKTDSDENPDPYQAANTSMSHEAIGIWTALGALTLGAPLWLAVLVGFLPWGVIWEGIQYRRLPTVRTLRDTLLADNPSYLMGALAISLVWYYGWIAWVLMTPILILLPAIVGAVFGRLPK